MNLLIFIFRLNFLKKYKMRVGRKFFYKFLSTLKKIIKIFNFLYSFYILSIFSIYFIVYSF